MLPRYPMQTMSNDNLSEWEGGLVTETMGSNVTASGRGESEAGECSCRICQGGGTQGAPKLRAACGPAGSAARAQPHEIHPCPVARQSTDMQAAGGGYHASGIIEGKWVHKGRDSGGAISGGVHACDTAGDGGRGYTIGEQCRERAKVGRRSGADLCCCANKEATSRACWGDWATGGREAGELEGTGGQKGGYWTRWLEREGPRRARRRRENKGRAREEGGTPLFACFCYVIYTKENVNCAFEKNLRGLRVQKRFANYTFFFGNKKLSLLCNFGHPQ